MNRHQLAKRIKRIMDQTIYEKGYITPVDVFLKLDKLSKQNYEAWRKKRIPYLERVMRGNLNQFSFIMKEIRLHARKRELKASWTSYKSWGKGQKVDLTFSKSGNPILEKAYATHYIDSNRLKKKGD
ncbi:hypothetical protein EV207_13130 [Scopulibacillus darangshiensis]|uniref:Uncharacterized protein n=1 Tax=Scopulibacillus darangshiensis TaxID=442528 RepID=A0A4R2NQ22_9BACL|nr:hypothetical protein [Scopulibacillus darangshiensis]TCP23468.1 hypothetical protein EV207_13130 [Scopulibacillus darangshiensis]